MLSETKSKFLRNINFLKNTVFPITERLAGFKYSSNKLKNASSRIVVPLAFEAFVGLIEKSLKKKFPSNLTFTKEEVISADEEILNIFSKPNFDFTRLNLDLLLTASLHASSDCGLFEFDLNKMSPSDSVDRYPKSSSSGYPYFRPKKEPEPKTDAVKWATNYMDNPTISDILKQPTSVFHRFQYKVSSNLKEIVKKIRPVWGLSYRISCLEGVYFRDIVDKGAVFQSNQRVPFVAQGLTNAQISDRIVKQFRKEYKTIYSIDVKQFDSNVPSFLWALFFANLPELVEQTPIDNKILSNLMAFYCYTPYCYRGTDLRFQKKGVPSGSLITSYFDSWVSRVVTNYAFLEKCGFEAANHCCVLGDDNIICGDYFTLDYITDVYDRFGLPVSIDKSGTYYYNTEISFLGRIWDVQNRPTEPENWYVAHLALPSRFYTKLPFPVSIMQTYRGLSLCMSLYKGIETYERLVGYGDTVWIDIKRNYEIFGENPTIRVISEDMTTFMVGIPLSRILSGDWRQF